MASEDEKRIAGEAAAAMISSGDVVGLGSGSTVRYFFKKLAERIWKEKLSVLGVPTSDGAKTFCEGLGITVVSLEEAGHVDVAVDGADEVDPKFFLIKGGGGCHTREKIVDTSARKFIVVVDSSKLVPMLGKFPIAVEVLPELEGKINKVLEKLGCKAVLRRNFVTDNGNIIYDCFFGKIEKPEELERKINLIEGVVDNGIFSRRPDIVIIGKGNRAEIIRRGRG